MLISTRPVSDQIRPWSHQSTTFRQGSRDIGDAPNSKEHNNSDLKSACADKARWPFISTQMSSLGSSDGDNQHLCAQETLTSCCSLATEESLAWRLLDECGLPVLLKRSCAVCLPGTSAEHGRKGWSYGHKWAEFKYTLGPKTNSLMHHTQEYIHCLLL